MKYNKNTSFYPVNICIVVDKILSTNQATFQIDFWLRRLPQREPHCWRVTTTNATAITKTTIRTTTLLVSLTHIAHDLF